jgi:hypothetical protein
MSAAQRIADFSSTVSPHASHEERTLAVAAALAAYALLMAAPGELSGTRAAKRLIRIAASGMDVANLAGAASALISALWPIFHQE